LGAKTSRVARAVVGLLGPTDRGALGLTALPLRRGLTLTRCIDVDAVEKVAARVFGQQRRGHGLRRCQRVSEGPLQILEE
jgi:hypothetical protein